MGNDVSEAFALEQLLADHRWVGRLARRLVGDRDEADDVVQETWLAAVRHPPTAGAPARPWLATVARNAAATLALARRRRQAREAQAELPRDAGESPEDLVARFQVQRLLAALVDGLAEPFRQTLLLRYYAGHSAADIAAMLGVPAGTVRWRLKRALDVLRARLDEQHGGSRVRWVAAFAPVARVMDRPGPDLTTSTRSPGGQRLDRSRTPALPRGSLPAAMVAVATMGLVVTALRPQGEPRGTSPGPSQVPQPGSSAGRPFAPLLDGLGPGWRAGPAAAGSVLHGRIVDPTGKPVAGATVKVYRQPSVLRPDEAAEPSAPQQVLTGPDGLFGLSGLRPGYHNLIASAPGFAVGGRMSVDMAAPGPPPWIEIVLRAGGVVLAGRVLDAGGGPIPGATVRVDSTGQPPGEARGNAPWINGHTITTDGEGSYQVRLAPSDYNIYVRASGYAPAWFSVGLRADQTRDVRLEPGGSVSGRVVTVGDGQPVAGAEVFSIPVDGVAEQPAARRRGRTKTTADPHGRFDLGPLLPGPYTLIARQTGLIGETPGPVQIQPGGASASVEIAVGTGLTVEGTVHADGRPVAEAFVRLRAQDLLRSTIRDGIPQARTDGAGRFRLAGVLPGDYRLEVPGADRWGTRGGGGWGPFEAPLVVRRSLTSAVELPRATRVTGVVLTAAGRPAARAIVESPPHDRARADASGRFLFEGLAPGQLRLVAMLGDETARLIGPTLAQGEPREVTLTLAPAARLSGIVTWEDGSPVAGYRIEAGPRIAPPTEEARTDASGRFSVGGLPAGTITLVANAPDAYPDPPVRGKPGSVFLEVAAGEHRTDVRLVLSRRQGRE
jgi:RNA polymerase sigma factor (sigma-70 family)